MCGGLAINMINVLIKPSEYNKEIYAVLLQSLLETNGQDIRIFCFGKSLENDNEFNMFSKKCHEMVFVDFKDDDYHNLFADIAFLKNSIHILAAHYYLPDELDRILYINEDVIINNNIEDFYNISFDDNYLVVRGQTSQKINGVFHKVGARLEKGQYFDSRIILINLKKIRSYFNLKKELNLLKGKEQIQNTQGILNIIFENKVKYDDQIKDNFRYTICQDAVRNKIDISDLPPRIICYENRDYYGIGINVLPWELKLEEETVEIYKKQGIIKSKYKLKECENINIDLVRIWWLYAERTIFYESLRDKMFCKREMIINKIEKSDHEIRQYMMEQTFFDDIRNGIREVDYSLLKTITYGRLNDYIDSVEPEVAVKIMKRIFYLSQKNISKQNTIKIGFLVYSSSEWQCEELYRKLAANKRFEVYIIIVGYNHGNEEDIHFNYINTYEYFLNKNHHVIYVGDVYKKIDIIENIDVLIYITPFEMVPENVNIIGRKLQQLCVHIPYCYYLENKADIYYGDDYYEKAAFKLTWCYFASCELEKKIAANEQSFHGYNIAVSGFPKIDSLIKRNFLSQENIWKTNDSTELKIIWAPHFNLEPGMNGTFYENYNWLLEFAKEHSEISWIVKPHPRMRIGAVKKGVFKSNEEYDIYMNKWNKLDNALVVESGDYYNIFLTSDAMILDSLSFLAEYQFTGKPLLLLQPEELRSMSEFGERLISVLYTARGNDFECITRFINNCIQNIDPQKESRKEFFHEYLDYEEKNGKTATDFIYDKFIESFVK